MSEHLDVLDELWLRTLDVHGGDMDVFRREVLWPLWAELQFWSVIEEAW